MSNINAYIPLAKSNTCLVFKLFRQTRFGIIKRLFFTGRQLLIISNAPKLLGYIKKNEVKTFSCIGYKDNEFPVLKTVEQNYLSYDWLDANINLGVFFVKNGDSLLSDNNWSSRFKSWLSFTEMFEVNIDREGFLTLQVSMYKAINKAIRKSKSSKELQERLNTIYSEYIDLAHMHTQTKGANVSDLLLVAQNLKGNKNSIVYG